MKPVEQALRLWFEERGLKASVNHEGSIVDVSVTATTREWEAFTGTELTSGLPVYTKAPGHPEETQAPATDRKLTLMYMHQDDRIIWQVFDAVTKELVGTLKSDTLTDAINRPTIDDVAALVEELKAKAYDLTRSRFGTIIETIMGESHQKNHPVYRLVKLTLDSIQKDMQAAIERQIPALTSSVLEVHRAEREARESAQWSESSRERIRSLREQADKLERDLNANERETRRERWFSSLNAMTPEGLDEAIKATEEILATPLSTQNHPSKSSHIGLPKPNR